MLWIWCLSLSYLHTAVSHIVAGIALWFGSCSRALATHWEGQWSFEAFKCSDEKPRSSKPKNQKTVWNRMKQWEGCYWSLVWFILNTGIENHLEMIACIMKSLSVAFGRKRLLISAQYGTWFRDLCFCESKPNGGCRTKLIKHLHIVSEKPFPFCRMVASQAKTASTIPELVDVLTSSLWLQHYVFNLFVKIDNRYLIMIWFWGVLSIQMHFKCQSV